MGLRGMQDLPNLLLPLLQNPLQLICTQSYPGKALVIHNNLSTICHVRFLCKHISNGVPTVHIIEAPNFE